MILYPAIDLKEGQCVRLHQGDMAQDTVYNDNPAAQATEFAQAGFSWLHIVDLNGAIEGKPINGQAVEDIIAATDLPVQLGGGIRTLQQIEDWLQKGVSRVILGTVAVKNPDLVFEACAKFPGQIVLGLDGFGLDMATEGWVEKAGGHIITLAQKFEDAGVSDIIYTDINKDGTGTGLNMANTIQLAQSVSIPVIASGGVGSLKDLQAVKEAAKEGVEGVIIGKALYDGRIDPIEALQVAA